MMQLAKANAEKYAHVGIMEDFTGSLEIFSAVFPKYFRTVGLHYAKLLKEFGPGGEFGGKYPRLTAEVREIVAANMTMELEFYAFLRQKHFLKLALLGSRGRA